MLWVPGAKGLLGSTLLSMAEGIGTGREVDIADLSQLRQFIKDHPTITHIVNCAAFSLVDRSETEREEAYLANAIGPGNLALMAKEIGAKLIHISTDYVFGGTIHSPLKETDPTAPSNYYGITKLEGELRIQKTLPSACIIRTSWIFGKGGKNFVATLLGMIQNQKEIRLSNDQWGRPTYAPDLAEAILQMFDHSGIYHFANRGIATKYEFGMAICEALGISRSIVAVPSSTFPSPCKRPIYSAFDTTKIEKIIPIRSWKEALRDYLCPIACS